MEPQAEYAYRRPNATAPRIHIQGPSDKQDHWKNICGNGSSHRSNTMGKPEPPEAFFKMMKTNLSRCCPLCIMQAISRGMITITVN